MENLPLFAIEGAALAGKTTLLKSLYNQYPEEFILIPEASEFVGGDQNFPDVPFKTLDDAKASTHFFIELEKQRLNFAKKKYQENPRPILLDRTTPVSSLIFYSLLKFSNPENSEFIKNFYEHAVSAFDAEVESGNLLIPSYIIYVHPTTEETFVSRFGRGTKNNVFARVDSLHFLDEEYHKLIELYYPNTHLLVYSENTTENLKTNTLKIASFLRRNPGGEILSLFQNFLNENVVPHQIDLKKEYVTYNKQIQRCRSLINTQNYE